MFTELEWEISKHGDLLEREHSQFIVEKMEAYGKIWQVFIGNQGGAQMAEIPNISNSLSELRIKFSEMNYTIFESIVCMKRIHDRHKTVIQVHHLNDSIDLLNDFIAFMAHVGRARDNALNICLLLFGKNETVSTQLVEWYEQRNSVLHGKKLPFTIEDGLYQIARPKGAEQRNDYYNNQTWTEANNFTFEFIADFIAQNFEKMTCVINKIMHNWFANIEQRMSGEGLRLASPPSSLTINDNISTEISGSSK